MKKNYLIILISISVLLILSCIATGIMASKLMDKKSDDKVYEIGETKIASLVEFYPDDLELQNFSYITNNTIYEKFYSYKVKNDNVETIVSYYNEYLSSDLNFIDISDASTLNEFIFEKTYEDNADSLAVTISYTDSKIDIVLTYTYLD